MQLVISASIIFLLHGQACHAVENVTAHGQVTIPLGFHDYVATLSFQYPLPKYGIDPALLWGDLAAKVEDDARRRPFSSRGTAPRYDVWPVLTLDPDDKSPIQPSWLVRLSILPAPKCEVKTVDQGLLLGLAKVLKFLDEEWPIKRDRDFTGTIGVGDDVHYELKLMATGSKVAKAERTQNSLDQKSLDVINSGRETILKQTTKRDTLYFIGSSGAPFFYSLNRPGDADKDKRSAYLIPLSMAHATDWATGDDPLGVLQSHKYEFNRYVDTYLRPGIKARTTSQKMPGRLILIDYLWTGETIRNLINVLQTKKVWSGNFHVLDMISPDDTANPKRRIEGITYLKNPIELVDNRQRRLIIQGGIPRCVAHYPWFYWDVNQEDVIDADKPYRAGVIRDIVQDAISGPSSAPSDKLPIVDGADLDEYDDGVGERLNSTSLDWPIDPGQAVVCSGQQSISAKAGIPGASLLPGAGIAASVGTS